MTVTGDPVLKKPILAVASTGGRLASKRMLYIVPQRMAFAFGFWAIVCEAQVTTPSASLCAHGVLLKPALPTVPSAAHAG